MLSITYNALVENQPVARLYMKHLVRSKRLYQTDYLSHRRIEETSIANQTD